MMYLLMPDRFIMEQNNDENSTSKPTIRALPNGGHGGILKNYKKLGYTYHP
jgi:hypothetical protein